MRARSALRAERLNHAREVWGRGPRPARRGAATGAGVWHLAAASLSGSAGGAALAGPGADPRGDDRVHREAVAAAWCGRCASRRRRTGLSLSEIVSRAITAQLARSRGAWVSAPSAPRARGALRISLRSVTGRQTRARVSGAGPGPALAGGWGGAPPAEERVNEHAQPPCTRACRRTGSGSRRRSRVRRPRCRRMPPRMTMWCRARGSSRMTATAAPPWSAPAWKPCGISPPRARSRPCWCMPRIASVANTRIRSC